MVRPPSGSVRAVFAVLAAIALWLGAPAAEATVDPFYTDLLERGTRELESGRPAEAERLLRTACFGLLDDTSLLTEGLIQLGRAQARSGEAASLRRTLDRLLAVESRFGSYSALDRKDLEAALERDLSVALPAAEIEATGLFALSEPALAEPPPEPVPTRRQQRRALEQKLADSPSDRDALWGLAELDVSARRLKRAAGWLDRLLSEYPDDRPALCFRGEIAVLRDECEPVLAALECAGVVTRAAAAMFAADCLDAAGRGAEADELRASLPEDQTANEDGPEASDPAPPQIEVPASNQPETVSADPDPLEGAGDGEQPAADRTDSGEPESGPSAGDRPSPGESAAEEATPVELVTRGDGAPLAVRLLRLRDAVDRARVRSDLDEVRVRAEALAAEHPESNTAQFLAAEIAFRSADYSSAVDYFARGGNPSPEQHVLLFFQAVSMFETGDLQGAEEALSQARPKLEADAPSEYVRSYIDKILGLAAE